jgi:hypothetical protein
VKCKEVKLFGEVYVLSVIYSYVEVFDHKRGQQVKMNNAKESTSSNGMAQWCCHLKRQRIQVFLRGQAF